MVQMRAWFAGLGLLAVLALAVAAAGLVAYAHRPPMYDVWLNDRQVATGSDLDELSATIAGSVEQDRNRTVVLQSGGRSWEFRLSELGMGRPAEPAADAAAAALAEAPGPGPLSLSRPAVRVDLRTSWDAEQLEVALLPVKQALGQEPIPAELKIEDHSPVIIPEVTGVTVDTGSLLKELQRHPDAAAFEVPLVPQLPAVTRQSLADMHITRLIAEWSTDYDPSIPRGDNVARAAKAFDGVKVAPGEILSYNATVGPVDAANGWKEAWVIENGKLVPGIGGGVCQVATTFYGAALRAGIVIMERHQHALAISYVAPSQDAAISQGSQDLKIMNSLSGYIYIETQTEGGTVTFRIYGETPAGQEVKIESRVLSSIPFTTDRVHDSGLAPGTTAVRSHGVSGLASEAIRLFYQDGALVRTEKLSRDSYLPTAEVVAWN